MAQILVIDDEIGDRHTFDNEMFKMEYGGLPFEFVFCDGRNQNRQYDVHSVMEFIDQHLGADIIILDWSFGGQELGIQVLRFLANIAEFNVPVLMYTSAPDERFTSKCLALGAASVLRKGASCEEFRDEILRLIQSK